jgi:hypothetical protein
VRVYSFIILVSCLFTLGVLGPWEFSGGPGHVFSVRMWLRCVECRAGTILFRRSAGADGGTVQIFLSSYLCCSGYGTVELVRGGGPSFSCFLQFAVISLGGWMSVVGFFVLYIFEFLW